MMKMSRILATVLCLVMGLSVCAGAMATDYTSVTLAGSTSGTDSITFYLPDPNQNNKLVKFTLQSNNVTFSIDYFQSISGRILEKGTEAWTSFYNQLDESRRSSMDENTAMIFEINVTPRTDVTFEDNHFTIKVESQEFYGWNSGDLYFYYISAGEDENIIHSIPVADNMVTGVVDHFSPYIIYKEKVEIPVPAPVAPPADSAAPAVTAPKTGDDSQLALWVALLAVSAGAMVLVARKRRHA